MAGARFVPKRSEFKRFERGLEVQAMLAQAGNALQGRVGEGFDSQVHVGRDRARATVMAKTPEARRRAYRDHAIERAAGGGPL